MAPNKWSDPWRNRQHLLSRLSRRGWRVVYSNGLLHSWEVPQEIRRGTALTGRFAAADGVDVFEHGLLPFRWTSRPSIDHWGLRHHAREMLAHCGASHAEILLLFHPMYLPYVRWLSPRRIVYYMYDGLAGELQQDHQLRNDWHSLVEGSDLIIATSEAIAAQIPTGARDRTRVLHNGADVATIRSLAAAACPSPIRGIPRPRICYTGVVNAKVDYVMIAEVARREPGWHWVIVGPVVDFATGGNAEWELQALARAQCMNLANVHFLGRLAYPDFLSGLHHMDVNVICNRTDEGWWQHAHPLKFHEYLASGRPVVSSPIHSLRRYVEVTDFARTVDDWIAALRRAIERGGVGTDERRMEIAAENDWSSRTDVLESWLLETLARTDEPRGADARLNST
jgi:glycosyltransferase involved in cell wall biosynthesis